MIEFAKKGLEIIRREGVMALFDRAWSKRDRRRFYRDYRKWIEQYERLTDDEIRSAVAISDAFAHRPLISVLMPVYNVDGIWLRQAIESVHRQIYTNWQLCIADDHSTKTHIREILDEVANADDRVKVVYRQTNGHISAASNSALALADGEFTVLLDHDDVLAPTALYFLIKEINEYPAAEIIYSDEDKIDSRGHRFAPVFKPDWSPELMNSFNVFTHMIAYRTALVKRLGFRLGHEGSQDYDLALRAISIVDADKIRHIPRVLYHWRAVSGSVAFSSGEKQYAHERARTAITEHLREKGIAATAVKGVGETHRLHFDTSERLPLISIIVFGSGDSTEEALAHSDLGYSYETIAISRVEKSRIETSDGDGLYDRLNSAASSAQGELLLFLDGSAREFSPGWAGELAGFANRPEIAAVGAKLIYPDRCIKFAGFVLLPDGIGRPFAGKRSNYLGNSFRPAVVQNVSAVSIDCLMIRTSLFRELGGFDAATFKDRYGDIDLCLRSLKRGYRNVWTPWAEIVQDRRGSADDARALVSLRHRWPEYFQRDLYYNPNLSIENAGDALAHPPRQDRF